MKIVKTLLVAIMAIFLFGSANAQVRIKARIGAPVHHRVIVHHYHHPRHVIVRHRR